MKETSKIKLSINKHDLIFVEQLLNKDQTDITTWRGKENITKKIPKWFKQIQKRLAEEENSAKGEKETKQNLYTTKMAESSGTLGKKADKLQRCIGCPKNIKRKGCYFKYQKDLLSEVIVDKKKKIHAEISELLGSQMQQIRNVTIREDIQQRVLTRKKPELRNDEDISRSGRGIVKNIQRIETSENSHSENRCSKNEEEKRRNENKNMYNNNNKEKEFRYRNKGEKRRRKIRNGSYRDSNNGHKNPPCTAKYIYELS
ncbi:hypothetical protein C2G38_2176273 [Gigaspora rosea]|uniref:Uncharacterized protein n=1 Tax=Gigaspora rosea TaxID=44941 RepID=A0A397VIC4_9GLOM|nr:hypothetical protein C2G38_2176273 [Gigaspora rosea]